jgi:CPA2 family monovalent cation:H+ antiporter-2
MVETARALNPRLDVLLRTHTDGETEILRRDAMGTVFMGEAELARAMTDRIVSDWAERRTRVESLT